MHGFYRPDLTVDTTKMFTSVTQFIKGSNGELSDIKRFYVQNGKTITNSESTVKGNPVNSIIADFRASQKRCSATATSF